MSNLRSENDQCPAATAQRVIGGKWKIVILWTLSEKDRRFSELSRILTPITQGMLTQQLRELERDGIVHREIFKEIPPRVEYSLTPVGQKLIPLLQLMCKWGSEYLDVQSKKDI